MRQFQLVGSPQGRRQTAGPLTGVALTAVMTAICAFGNQAPAEETGRVPEAPPTYTLAEGDQITIHSSVVAEVSEKSYRIESDGCVKAPLVGRVRAAGETVRGLEEVLAKKFEQF